MQYHYSVLELKPGATKAEVKAAFRRLVKKYHPDINPTLEAAQKFLDVTQAYDALRDYDPQRTYSGIRVRNGNYNEFWKRAQQEMAQSMKEYGSTR